MEDSPAPPQSTRSNVSSRSNAGDAKTSASGSPALRGSVLSFDGRKLASRSERQRRESLKSIEVDGNDGQPEITDEQLDKVFLSYAKLTEPNTYKTLNVMQFSTIWRLITGVRGNLFQEMKIFNQ